MASIPEGVHWIGDDHGRYDEKPAIEVSLSAFTIDRLGVTRGEFDAFAHATGYVAQGPWRRVSVGPVRLVNWYDADAYCHWRKARLPTAAEWEIAAPEAALREWTGDWYDRYLYASIRGVAVINPHGPEDGTPPETRFSETLNAAGNERSTRKVVKGGSLTRRGAHAPALWYEDVGFRCARSSDLAR